MSILLPEILSLIGLLTSSLVFYTCAYRINRENLNMEGFTLSNRNLSKNQFGNTFTASSMSLATVLVFFISTQKEYGLFLLACPIGFVLGQYIFFYTVRKCNVDFSKCRTISDLVSTVFPSKKIARAITAITIVSYIGLAFIELYVGTIILTFFMPKSAIWQTLAFFIIGITVLLYIRLGGYKAIVKTDKWQLSLMLLAITTIFLFSILLPYSDTPKTYVNSFYFVNVSPIWALVFVIQILFTNITGPFTQLTGWQRIVASSSVDEAWKGLKRATWKTLFIWTVPIISFVLLRTKGYDITELEKFLYFARNTSELTATILFPIVVVGFASALFSSADVAIIAIIHALSDQNTFQSSFQKLPYRKFKRYLTIFTICILAILSALYWIKYLELTNYLVPLVHSSFGQMNILIPLSAYAIYRINNNQQETKFNENYIFFSILLGWSFVLIGVWLSAKYKFPGLQQAIVVVSILPILVTTFINMRYRQKSLSYSSSY
ncbi:MAG: hypothetical protein HRT87_04605 [Legionellales bacterium]|nr:hypothetical protein [Legionellales bacterium]